MATIPFNFFVRYAPGDPLDPAHNRFMYNQDGGAPAIPPLNSGDTIDASIFFLDDPGIGHRYAGSTIEMRLRAQGNGTTYATHVASGELTPSVAPAISRVGTGSDSVTEKQRVVFDAIGGTFNLIVNQPTGTLHRPYGSDSYFCYGTVNGIPAGGTRAQIEDFINATLQWKLLGSFGVIGGPYDHTQVPAQCLIRITNYTQYKGFDIEFGTLAAWPATPTRNQNPMVYSIPLCPLDTANMGQTYGWKVPLLLDGNGHTFSDLFLSANGPSYLEVLLDGVIAAQYQLTTTTGGGIGGGGSGGDPPPPPPGGGGPPSAIDGIVYDGDHFSSAWAVGVMRTETAFPDKPGYYIYRQRYRIARSSYSDLPLDSICPKDSNAYLVMETEREDVGGADLQEWDRVWANVPPPIVDVEVVDYIWQTTGILNGVWAIRSLPLSRLATRTRTFYHTSNPASISVARLPRAAVFAGVRILFDGYQDLFGGASTIARDDLVQRWMGNIWMKTQWQITI